MSIMDTSEELLTTGQVARLMGVNPKTVTRWAKQGKLRSIRTPSGHRRFRASELRRVLSASR